MITVFGREGPIWYGTGFLFHKAKFLATNVHVAGLEGVRDTWFFSPDDQFLLESRSGEVDAAAWRQRQSWHEDICALPVRSARDKGIDRYVGFKDLKIGQEVWTLGHAGGRPWQDSRGQIVALLDGTFDQKDRSRIRTDLAPLLARDCLKSFERYRRLIITRGGFTIPGNSGGPVVDEYGRLVGVCYAGSMSFDAVIPMEYLFRPLNLSVPHTTKVE